MRILIVASFVAASLAAAAPAARAAEPREPAAPTRTRPSLGSAVARIRSAPDLSATVEAYAAARAAYPGRTLVTSSYVRRMTELGLPEAAVTQAIDVLQVDLGDGVARAVVAAARARTGDAEGALRGLATAATYEPEDPFVRRSAGQILAWLDTRRGRMAEDIETAADGMRRTLSATPEFRAAYDAAHAAYLADRAATPATLAARPTSPVLLADTVDADYEIDDRPILVQMAPALFAARCAFPRATYWNACDSYFRAQRLCGPRRFAPLGCGVRGADVIYTLRSTTRATPLGHYSMSSGTSRLRWSRSSDCAPQRSRCEPVCR